VGSYLSVYSSHQNVSYIYIENGEENFKLNKLCLTSFGLQNNSAQMHHHSCTMCTYYNIFYWLRKKKWPLIRQQSERKLCTFHRTVSYQEICLSWYFVCCMDRVSFRASLYSLFQCHSRVQPFTTASLQLAFTCIETLSQQDNYYCSHYSIQQYNTH
jgi:hypothetical protein